MGATTKVNLPNLLYPLDAMRLGYDQQPYQGGWCDDLYCLHCPSQRVVGCDGGEVDGVDDSGCDDGGGNSANGSKDSPNPNSKGCSNHCTSPYSSSNRMDYSHSIRSSHSGKDFPIHSTNYR